MQKSKYQVYGKTPKKNVRMKLNMKTFRILLFFIVTAGFIAGSVFGVRKLYIEYRIFNEKVDISNDPAFKEQGPTTSNEEFVPSAKLLNLTYTTQAPFANWNIHEESCEEAALLMYHYFLDGRTTFEGKSVIPNQLADDEEVKMKNWQVQNYGKEPDLTMQAWGQFAKDYYGHNFQVFNNITKEDIKREIAKGHPVLVPVITHSLQNPHYGRNPSYHVLLLKGYKEEGVVANDSGIKEGENYFYSWDVLFKAIDAQTAKMNQGRTMVILTK